MRIWHWLRRGATHREPVTLRQSVQSAMSQVVVSAHGTVGLLAAAEGRSDGRARRGSHRRAADHLETVAHDGRQRS